MITYEDNILTDTNTGSYVERYEKTYFDDGQFDGYMLFFKNGYKLEVDEDDCLNEDDIKHLIKEKIYVRIKYMLSLWKGDIKHDTITGNHIGKVKE